MKTSPDYQYAEELKKILESNINLAPLLFDQIFDDNAQVDSLILAASSPQGIITITPGASPMTFERTAGGILYRLDTEFAITVWTLNNMIDLPEGIHSAAQYRSAIVTQILKTIAEQWRKNQFVTFEQPAILNIDDVSIKHNNIPDLAARSITLTTFINYA